MRQGFIMELDCKKKIQGSGKRSWKRNKPPFQHQGKELGIDVFAMTKRENRILSLTFSTKG